MLLVICSMRDLKANSFANPFVCQSVGQALRHFADEVNRPSEDNLLYRHPEDFELFRVGTFDTETGRVSGLQDLEQLAVASNFVIKQPGSAQRAS